MDRPAHGDHDNFLLKSKTRVTLKIVTTKPQARSTISRQGYNGEFRRPVAGERPAQRGQRGIEIFSGPERSHPLKRRDSRKEKKEKERNFNVSPLS
jgi:hypothetical protein